MSNQIINQIYIIGIIFFLLSNLYYLFIPKNKFPKYFQITRGYQSNMEKYDWDKTIKRHKIFLFVSLIFLVLFYILFKFLGLFMGNLGLILYAVIAVILSFWVGPVKKNLKKICDFRAKCKSVFLWRVHESVCYIW